MRNQILNGSPILEPMNNQNNRKNNALIILFKFQFFICISIVFFGLIYYFNLLYSTKQNEENSKRLIEKFNITTLYSANNQYTTKTLVNDSSFVIGVIDIPSVDITYPILSDYNDDLLKLSPCRFFGPMPNEVGNLCIAGHNYHSYKFFSKLIDISIGDTISIYDMSGNKLNYSVYDKFIVDSDNLSCTSQNTNGKKEVTLVTCNTNRQKRTIVKAKEIE